MPSNGLHVIAPREKDLGDGFKVRRSLPHASQRSVGPFVFLDEMGPATFPPGGGLDVRPHPHIGLATVTYLFEGAMGHRDTTGVDIVLRPGGVNWMTAGRGVAHSERTPQSDRAAGPSLHGVQAWVALPKAHEEDPPEFQFISREALPESRRDGIFLRVIAGDGWGLSAPTRVLHPTIYAHADLDVGASLVFAPRWAERAVYVVRGTVQVEGETLGSGALAVLPTDQEVQIQARKDARLMLLGGAPLDGPRTIFWNFVHHDPERIEKAKQDWRDSIAGEWRDTPFAMPPNEHEHIPLPGDPEPEGPPQCSDEEPKS